MDDPKYWDNSNGPSADTAIDQARDQWQRMYRDNEAAGRETPVVDVPASLGDVARTSVEATTELARRSRSRSYVVTIDLRALEAAYQAELARQRAPTAQAAQEDRAPAPAPAPEPVPAPAPAKPQSSRSRRRRAAPGGR